MDRLVFLRRNSLPFQLLVRNDGMMYVCYIIIFIFTLIKQKVPQEYERTYLLTSEEKTHKYYT